MKLPKVRFRILHNKDKASRPKIYQVDDPIFEFAQYLSCDPDIVHDALISYPDPGEETPESFAMYKQSVAKNIRIANLASSLATELFGRKTPIERQFGTEVVEGVYGVSLESLNRLALNCYEDADLLGAELKTKSRKGGKRRDAIVVASIVHDVFVATGRSISAQHVSGKAVTEFGQAVVQALKIWGIKADWRRASEAVLNGERANFARMDGDDANSDLDF